MNPFLAPKRRPLVVGHRGVPALHQENSLAGFRRAVALGLPAAELDVRLTADGRAVVCHDNDLERLTGERVLLDELSWDRASKLRLRRQLPMGTGPHGEAVVMRYDREEPLALLDEVLAEVGDALALNVELKLDLEHPFDTRVAPIAAEAIERAGLADRVIVTSFDPRKLRLARKTRKGLAIGFCFDDGMFDLLGPRGRGWLGRVLEANVVGRILKTKLVGAEHTLVGPETVARLHARGVAIGTHTLFPLGSTAGKPIAPAAATEAEVHRLVALGVDWIESDDGARLLDVVSRAP
ncbi:MAG TPA: glycerophosphodiester phosphodiesterase [Kofleriaceae bacterium]